MRLLTRATRTSETRSSTYLRMARNISARERQIALIPLITLFIEHGAPHWDCFFESNFIPQRCFKPIKLLELSLRSYDAKGMQSSFLISNAAALQFTGGGLKKNVTAQQKHNATFACNNQLLCGCILS